jgi:hypothetical protein
MKTSSCAAGNECGYGPPQTGEGVMAKTIAWSGLRILAPVLVAFSVSVPVHADDIAPCTVPKGAFAVSPPRDLPPVLSMDLYLRLGDIVAPGQAFQATDVGDGSKSRRFIFAWHAGDKWVIATEHGGRGYNDPIFLYKMGEDKSPSLIDSQITEPAGVCRTATKLLQE